MFTLRKLSVSLADRLIVSNINLSVGDGELHALMGPNGSGKSTLSLALMGHQEYQINPDASAVINGHELLHLKPEERAKLGLFLSFQHPIDIPGLSVQQLLKLIHDHLHPHSSMTMTEFRHKLSEYTDLLSIQSEFLTRFVNDGFSGGEKKRLEMLQLLVAEPKVAILDEIDSGLDVDAIRIVANAVKYAQTKYRTSFLVITHYRRILDYLNPTWVHVLAKGQLIKSGDREVIEEIEQTGYRQL